MPYPTNRGDSSFQQCKTCSSLYLSLYFLMQIKCNSQDIRSQRNPCPIHHSRQFCRRFLSVTRCMTQACDGRHRVVPQSVRPGLSRPLTASSVLGPMCRSALGSCTFSSCCSVMSHARRPCRLFSQNSCRQPQTRHKSARSAPIIGIANSVIGIPSSVGHKVDDCQGQEV